MIDMLSDIQCALYKQVAEMQSFGVAPKYLYLNPGDAQQAYDELQSKWAGESIPPAWGTFSVININGQMIQIKEQASQPQGTAYLSEHDLDNPKAPKFRWEAGL